MIRLRRIAAFLLLTVWLTATQHCALEAAGFWDALGSSEHCACCTNSGDDCSDDGCDLIEGTSITAANCTLKIPQAELACDLAILFVRELTAPAELAPSADVSDPLDRPLNWVASWDFSRRTAPPSRAPAV